MPPDEADEFSTYEVRLTEPAEAEAEAAYLGRMQYGLRVAERWYAGLTNAFESLAQLPHRCITAPESDTLGGGVRQLIYGKGSSAYRILFRVIEPDAENTGVVRILHVRHASQQRFGEQPYTEPSQPLQMYACKGCFGIEDIKAQLVYPRRASIFSTYSPTIWLAAASLSASA